MVLSLIQMHLNRLTGGFVPPPTSYGTSPEGGCNVLLVHAHPLKDSFSAHLSRTVCSSLRGAGHKVHVINLYECEKGKPFNALLSAEERDRYLKGTPPSPYPEPSPDVVPHVQALRSADALVLIYPTWWMGVPTILKGWFDRVFLPGIAFRLPGVGGAPTNSTGALLPNLPNIKKVGVVTHYGSQRWMMATAGDGGHGLIARALLPLFGDECTIMWHGLYAIYSKSDQERAAFVESVSQAYSTFLPPPKKPSGSAGIAPGA